MKYVIGLHPTLGWPLPAVFDEMLMHAHVAEAMSRSLEEQVPIMSAGFVYIEAETGEVSVGTKPSTSLGIWPHPGDLDVLTKFLRYGLSGLRLAKRLAEAGEML